MIVVSLLNLSTSSSFNGNLFSTPIIFVFHNDDVTATNQPPGHGDRYVIVAVVTSSYFLTPHRVANELTRHPRDVAMGYGVLSSLVTGRCRHCRIVGGRRHRLRRRRRSMLLQRDVTSEHTDDSRRIHGRASRAMTCSRYRV